MSAQCSVSVANNALMRTVNGPKCQKEKKMKTSVSSHTCYERCTFIFIFYFFL